jgi:hypothetical protein
MKAKARIRSCHGGYEISIEDNPDRENWISDSGPFLAWRLKRAIKKLRHKAEIVRQVLEEMNR